MSSFNQEQPNIQNANSDKDTGRANSRDESAGRSTNGISAESKKDTSLFTLANLVFVFSAILSYVTLGLAHVNLPKYYPTLRQISVAPIKDAVAMGFYGRFVAALIVALTLTVLFLVFYPLLKKLDLTHLGLVNKLMVGAFWFGVTVIVLEEWHEWGIEKRGLDSGGLFNTEFGLFLLGLVIFFGGVLLTALGINRVKKIITQDQK